MLRVLSFIFVILGLFLLSACGKKTFTITFDTDGGTAIEVIKVKKGQLAQAPKDPEKDGYIFDGWYLSKDFAEANYFDFDIKVVNENITLYAKWKAAVVQKTDQEKVDEARNALSLGNIHNVTYDLNLPKSGLNGTTITWSSEKPEFVSNDGKVTRPKSNEDNAVVLLTATITLNNATATRTFSVTILKESQGYISVADAIAAPTGTQVHVTGVVSGVGGSRIAIQDEDGVGIYIWLGSGSVAASKIAVGDRVSISGTRAADKTVPQITTTLNDVTVIEQDQEVKSILVEDLEDFRSRGSVADFGVRYRFEGVFITGNNTSYIEFYEKNGFKMGILLNTLHPDIDIQALRDSVQVGDRVTFEALLFGIGGKKFENGQFLSVDPTSPQNAEMYRFILSDINDFTVLEKTDQDTADFYATKLTIQNINAIETNFDLVTSFVDNEEVTVSWTSDSDVIKIVDGKAVVTRPTNGQNATVKLTATVSYNGYTSIKEFNVTVLFDLSDEEKVAAAKDELSIGFIDGIVSNLTLPSTGLYGSTITWFSKDTEYLSHTGVVTLPSEDSVEVELEATITLNDATITKVFVVKIVSSLSDEEKVEQAVQQLSLGDLTNLNHTGTHKLNLVSEGIHGTTVTWTISDEHVIKQDGSILFPLNKASETVTLTATVKMGSIELTKEFTATVQGITEGITVSEVLTQATEEAVKVRGIVSAVSSRRVIIQDETGKGIYLWLGENLVNLFGTQDIKVGSAVVVEGSLVLATASVPAQINFPSGSKITLYAQGYNVAKEVVELEDLDAFRSQDFATEVAGKTVTFKSVTILLWDATRIVFYDKLGNKLAIRISGNILSPVQIALNAKGLKVYDVVNITTTFYGIDDTVIWSGILASADDIELAGNEGILDTAKNNIDLGNINEVISDLVLVNQVIVGENQVQVAWESSDEDTVGLDGKVTRPIGANKVVTLTATLTYDGKTTTKDFTVTVLGDLSIEDKLDAALDAISLNESYEVSFVLPVAGLHDSIIRWESSNTDVVTIDGSTAVVTNPSVGEPAMTVTLTAYVKIGDSYEVSKDIQITIEPTEITPEDIVQSQLDKVNFDDVDLDNLTSNLDFDFDFDDYAIVVEWSSSNEDVISTTGKVTQDHYLDKEVTLTRSE